MDNGCISSAIGRTALLSAKPICERRRADKLQSSRNLGALQVAVSRYQHRRLADHRELDQIVVARVVGNPPRRILWIIKLNALIAQAPNPGFDVREVELIFARNAWMLESLPHLG